MKISDEIHDWCDFYSGESINNDDCDKLRALADRIDSEMVELPRDRDGVRIHVGDTVWGCSSGMKVTIGELRMANADRWTAITTSGGHILHEIWDIGDGDGIYVDFNPCPSDTGVPETMAFSYDLRRKKVMSWTEMDVWHRDATGGRAMRDMGYEPVEEAER